MDPKILAQWLRDHGYVGNVGYLIPEVLAETLVDEFVIRRRR